MEEPGDDHGHQLATTSSSPVREEYQNCDNYGDDQSMAPPLAARLAQEDSRHEIDKIGEHGPENQQPQINLGIPEYPSKEEDRPGNVPQDHRSISNSIESGIGQGVGHEILLPRYVFEPVGNG